MKSAFYQTFSSPDAVSYNLFTLSNPERHSKERRKVASLYPMSMLVSYEEYVDSCNAVLCEKLQDQVSSQSILLLDIRWRLDIVLFGPWAVMLMNRT